MSHTSPPNSPPNENSAILQLVQLSGQFNEPLVSEVDVEDKENGKAPRHSLFKLFLIFLGFGLNAWGGPVAQIQMLQERLVIEEKWVTREKFNRVLAVYQMLPGPEATELCCYFGLMSRGRLGAFIAGLGFVAPGFILMMILSWIYVNYGLQSPYFAASFLSLQPAVAAMVFRATHKISEHAFADPDTKEFSNWLFTIGCIAAVLTVARVNFFLVLIFSGILYILVSKRKDGILWYILTIVFIVGGFVLWLVWIILTRRKRHPIDPSSSSSSSSAPVSSSGVGSESDSDMSIGNSIFAAKSLYSIFLLGLLAGLLTFGGAYTAIPFVQYYAVEQGKWLTYKQFMDGIAIGAVLPSPLVIFSTFVGFIGGGVPGALLMTLGMFLPAFSFTIVGHNFFEMLVENKSFSSFLDGVTAGVVGLIAVTAIDLFKQAIITQPVPAMGAVIYVVVLGALYTFKARAAGPLLVLAAALVGQILYIDHH